MTTIHTRQLQQYTQDNYNNIHKTTTTVHARQLTTIHTRQQQYTQDNYNNTHKTTTIHTIQQQYAQDNYNNTHRQLQQYKQDNYNNTPKTITTIHTIQLTTIPTRQLKIQHVQKVNNTKF